MTLILLLAALMTVESFIGWLIGLGIVVISVAAAKQDMDKTACVLFTVGAVIALVNMGW